MSSLLNLKKGVVDSGDINNSFAVASADGAISIPDRGSKVIFVTKAGVCAMTLTAPTATTHDGVRLTFVSTTAQAHTLTVATTGLNDLGGSGDVGTWGGAKGDGLTIVAYQADWYVVSNINVTIA